jgi:hypothetical protein
MTTYVPGEGYGRGYRERMNGGHLPMQANSQSSDPYWQEYATGWKDADAKIIREARQKHECDSAECDKNFIQD